MMAMTGFEGMRARIGGEASGIAGGQAAFCGLSDLL